MYTTGAAFLDALKEGGVSYLFCNFGSDHPAIIERLVEAASQGQELPRVVTCPNEMVGLSAAHGYAQVTGRAQAVLVHVECGTQSLAGAVHNVAKGRAPVLIFAGASPFTQEGELRGSRNEFIQWIQDVFDQRGLVRGYVKYENEIRTGRNVKQLVHRALQFAHSDPKGPVYLVGAREVTEEETLPVAIDVAEWAPIQPAALPPEGIDAIAGALAQARRPLVVTSYLGRSAAAVDGLVALCRRVGAGVLESVPNAVNFPADDPLYQGNQWNEQRQNPVLAAADVVLVVDSDVPWIPSVSRPAAGARVFHIDVDPLKQQMPLWHIPARQTFRADAALALRQIGERLASGAVAVDARAVEERQAHYAALHETRARVLAAREAVPAAGAPITPEYLTACVRAAIDDDTIVLSEGITSYGVIADHLARRCAGTLLTSGGGSLGWCGGAAIGVKLARPESTVVTLSGDGSYLFSIPSAVHWMARRYETPFLQVVYDNGGWKAPRFSTLAVHPAGYASAGDGKALGLSFAPAPDHAGIAAASGGAFARTITRPDEVAPALAEALDIVRREKRCAVLDVKLAQI
jgi:acetolactate synthase-1/2/3 large subunit